MSLKGKVVIVTGASRGIGESIAEAFAADGASVVVAARTEAPGGALSGTIHETVDKIKRRGGSALAVRCDLTKDTEVEALAQRAQDAFGRIDVLVNNAGVNFLSRFVDIPMKRWDLVLNVNLRGVVLCAKAVLPIMVRQRSGSIINISSMWSHVATPGNLAYGVSKAAIERFTIGLAEEVKHHGIAVNCIMPAGGVLTEGLQKAYKADMSHWTGAEAFAQSVLRLAAMPPTYTGHVLNDQEFIAYTEFQQIAPPEQTSIHTNP